MNETKKNAIEDINIRLDQAGERSVDDDHFKLSSLEENNNKKNEKE